MILRGPRPEKDGVSRWRIKDLCRIAEERFGVSYRPGGMRGLVKGLHLSWQKTRPRHPQANAAEQKAFKDPMRRRTARLGRVEGPRALDFYTDAYPAALR